MKIELKSVRRQAGSPGLARNPRLKTWRRGLALATVAGIAIACGPGFLDGISGGAVEVPDAADGTAPVDARACQPRTLPERPAGEDDKTSISVPTFAISSLRIDTLGAPDAGGAIPVGIDLDDRCTCPETDSCVRGGDAARACDDKHGEDNGMSAFFNSLNVGVPLFPQTFATDRIKLGFFTLLVEVLGWNGKDDDPSVVVTFRLSQQIDGKTDAGLPPPKFDGTDVWTVDPSSITGGAEAVGKDCRVAGDSYRCLARIRDDKAFVRAGRLISHPRLDGVATSAVPILVRTGLGLIDFNVVDLAVYATFTRAADGGVARIDGEMAGRVSAANVLRTIANLQDFTSMTTTVPVCKNTALFAVARSSVCATPDIAEPGKDNTGAKCDHISLAMSFGAEPAIAGPVFRKDDPPKVCDESIFSCP